MTELDSLEFCLRDFAMDARRPFQEAFGCSTGLMVSSGALLLLLGGRDVRSCCITPIPMSMLISISSGEASAELPDVYCAGWMWAFWWFWAVRAGDVSGLK